MDVRIFGFTVGTAEGWDPVDDLAVQFYDFRPNEIGKQWLSGAEFQEKDTLLVDFEDGEVLRMWEDQYGTVGGSEAPQVDFSVFNSSNVEE